MSSSDFFALEQFLGAYFHQDWTLEADSAAKVVHQYRQSASPAEIRNVLLDLRRLREERLSESQLENRLAKLGSCYHPTADGRSHQQWLEWLIQELEGSGAEPKKKSPRSKNGSSHS